MVYTRSHGGIWYFYNYFNNDNRTKWMMFIHLRLIYLKRVCSVPQLQFILSSSPLQFEENIIWPSFFPLSIIFKEQNQREKNTEHFTTKCIAQIINIIKTTHEKCTNQRIMPSIWQHSKIIFGNESNQIHIKNRSDTKNGFVFMITTQRVKIMIHVWIVTNSFEMVFFSFS